jgi:VIT1/CCC1 family predicted Fe2+/Mn2+ transporter
LFTSLVIAAVALAAGGMLVGRITGRPLLRSGARQLALGAVAIAVTFAIGHFVGSASA